MQEVSEPCQNFLAATAAAAKACAADLSRLPDAQRRTQKVACLSLPSSTSATTAIVISQIAAGRR